MQNTARSKAEEKFAKFKQQEKQALKERDKAQKATEEKTARLRALRLAKEAADKEQADKLAAENFMMMFLDVRVAPFVHVMSVLTGFTVLVLAAQIVLRAAAPSSRETAR